MHSSLFYFAALVTLSAAFCGSLLGGGGGGCGGGCGGCGRKKRSADVEWAGLHASHDDMLCNSAHLRNLINETISTSPDASKLALMTRLQAEGENQAVIICSADPFSYALPQHAEYCSHGNGSNMCHVFIL
ncbi:unnamed protein product, partial [Mesorhabditis spiculigera]